MGTKAHSRTSASALLSILLAFAIGSMPIIAALTLQASVVEALS